MKVLLGVPTILLSLFVFAQGSFAAGVVGATENLKIARGEGDHCFVKAFMAADPTDEQKAKAKEVGDSIKQVFEENKQAMEDAAKTYMMTLMKHPIPMEEAVAAAHGLGQAVHPVQVAMFGGTITVINLLTADQRTSFNRSMHQCMHDDEE